MSFITLVIYFAAGFVLAYFSTLQLRLVAHTKIVRATILTFFLQVISLFVLANIIAEINSKRSIGVVITYALGITIGTYVALRYKHLEGNS